MMEVWLPVPRAFRALYCLRKTERALAWLLDAASGERARGCQPWVRVMLRLLHGMGKFTVVCEMDMVR